MSLQPQAIQIVLVCGITAALTLKVVEEKIILES